MYKVARYGGCGTSLFASRNHSRRSLRHRALVFVLHSRQTVRNINLFQPLGAPFPSTLLLRPSLLLNYAFGKTPLERLYEFLRLERTQRYMSEKKKKLLMERDGRVKVQFFEIMENPPVVVLQLQLLRVREEPVTHRISQDIFIKQELS